MKASSEGVSIVVLLIVGFSISHFVLLPMLGIKSGPSSEQPPVQISAEQAYQIGYDHGVKAAMAGVIFRTNKEVFYMGEIEWRAALFHNGTVRLGRGEKTNGADFYRPVPVNTNYLEYRKEEWPTNTP